MTFFNFEIYFFFRNQKLFLKNLFSKIKKSTDQGIDVVLNVTRGKASGQITEVSIVQNFRDEFVETGAVNS
jgi:hypothetical protein